MLKFQIITNQKLLMLSEFATTFAWRKHTYKLSFGYPCKPKIHEILSIIVKAKQAFNLWGWLQAFSQPISLSISNENQDTFSLSVFISYPYSRTNHMCYPLPPVKTFQALKQLLVKRNLSARVRLLRKRRYNGRGNGVVSVLRIRCATPVCGPTFG